MSSVITDPEVLAFIAKTDSYYPLETVDFSIERQRQIYDGMCAVFRVQHPEGVATRDGQFDGPAGALRYRQYTPVGARPGRVLYFHGGGFVVGGLESHDDVCAEIAALCAVEVVSIDYRLCPEHPHPAAFDDAVAAARVFSDKPLILCGDSAGGNLAAAVALSHPDDVAGQVLIYPGLGGNALSLPSYSERADAPLLSTRDVLSYGVIRGGGVAPDADPTFSPLLSRSFAGAPPCFVSAAEHDPLRDDGPEFVARLRDAGVNAECVVEPELPHAHLRARHMSRRGREAFERICTAISGFLDEDL
ncbi:MAG: alpha/beta hydrolase [Pseudomonadota bacterium]